MAPHRAHREDEVGEDRDEAPAVAAPPTPASSVLALQRAAGNAAVAGWLRAAPAGLVQRDHKLPDDIDSLDDVGDVVGALQVDTTPFSETGRAGLFKKDQLPARPGIKVHTHFGGKMAAADKDEQAVRNGLGSMAMQRFGVDGVAPLKKGETTSWEAPKSTKPAKLRPPTADLVREEDLSLSTYGGQDGRYRFTAVARKGTGAKPTEVDLLIELIGAQKAAFKTWGELSSDRRTALLKLFAGYGFVKREPRAAGPLEEQETDAIDQWVDDKWAWVLQAIEQLPADALATVSGIEWQRGHPVPGKDKEDGFYETTTGKPGTPARRLTLYDTAFASRDRLVSVVAHEIGHAIASKPAEPAGGKGLHEDPGYVAAAKADGIAITSYGQTGGAREAYAEAYSMFVSEPSTMKTLRPKTYEWFEKQQAGFAKLRPKPAATKPAAAKPAATKPAATGAKH
jgi:hypothetical protein